MTTAQKPTIPEVAPLVRALFKRSSVACCLHIVLFDFNTKDDNVDWCIKHAVEEGCTECEHLGRLLRRMSRTQRGKLATMR